MARCDIPAQVWALFSTAPNLRGLFWTCIGLRGLLYATSLHLDLTNCSPSHNTLSAFNYCLEGSGLRVTHSTGSLRGSVGAACVRVSIECAECPLYDDRGIEGSAEFHCAFSFFISPPPTLITYCTASTPVQMASRAASGKVPRVCRSCDCERLILSRRQNSEMISDTILIRHDMQPHTLKRVVALEVKAPPSPGLNFYFPPPTRDKISQLC